MFIITYVNIDMDSMFSNCKKLEYINMINFKDLDSRFWQDDMFKNVPENVVLCINKTNIKKKNISSNRKNIMSY